MLSCGFNLLCSSFNAFYIIFECNGIIIKINDMPYNNNFINAEIWYTENILGHKKLRH